MMSSFTIRVCFVRKRINLSRSTIRQLGNPTHLNFWYDEFEGNLIISPAEKDDLDAYEIPKYFWKNTKNSSCVISQIAFLTALQHRIGWENGSRYTFKGSVTESTNVPAVVFNLTEGKRLC